MVNKDFQNKHIGTEIIDELLIYLKENNYRLVRLGVVKGNILGESFWSKFGFKKTGEIIKQNSLEISSMEKVLI